MARLGRRLLRGVLRPMIGMSSRTIAIKLNDMGIGAPRGVTRVG